MTTADWRVRLRAARKRLGVSQARLAELAGLSLETVRGSKMAAAARSASI